MSAGWHHATTGSALQHAVWYVVRSIDGIVQHLEFDAEIGGDKWPPCSNLRGLNCLRLDLHAEARNCGIAGVRPYKLVARAVELLEPAAEAHDAGDLDPWRTARPEVREILAQLRQFLAKPTLKVEARAAPVAPPKPATDTSRPDCAQANVDGGRKGEKAEKAPAVPQGRPRKAADATRAAEAAWWRDRAHQEPEIADQCEDDRLDQLFGRIMDAELEIHLRELGAEDRPKWWPNGPNGRPVHVVRFRDRWATASPSTWAKYVQRFDNDASRGRGVVPRHHQKNVEPQTSGELAGKPARMTKAEAAARAFEEAATTAAGLLIASGRARGKILDNLRRTLSRVGIGDQDADDLLDLDPAAMVAEFEKRRLAVEELQAGTKTRR